MSSGDTVYRYTLPLDTSGLVDTPEYEISPNGELLKCHYRVRTVVVVQTEPSPHFHKDSVNVHVTKMDRDEFERMRSD